MMLPTPPASSTGKHLERGHDAIERAPVGLIAVMSAATAPANDSERALEIAGLGRASTELTADRIGERAEAVDRRRRLPAARRTAQAPARMRSAGQPSMRRPGRSHPQEWTGHCPRALDHGAF